MEQLVKRAEKVGALLKERKETIAVAESSTGGLLTAALLAVPGASAYCVGGAVIYTKEAWRGVGFDVERGKRTRSATEAMALLRAELVRERFGASWGVGETGAAGPTGNRYGDPAGHTCIAVVGAVSRAITLRTNRSERLENMYAFAARALELLEEALG